MKSGFLLAKECAPHLKETRYDFFSCRFFVILQQNHDRAHPKLSRSKYGLRTEKL